MTTGVVLVLWLVLTLGARPLAPVIGSLLEWGEVSVGLDVSHGVRTLEDSP